MAVRILKTNLAVESHPTPGALILKTNLAVESHPTPGPLILKTNLAVESMDTYPLYADSGSYVITGAPVNLLATIPPALFTGALGGFPLAGFPTRASGYYLNADPGSYALTGVNPALLYARIMNMYSELVTNGGFSGNTVGWTVDDPAITFTASGGYGVLTIPAGMDGYAYQTLSVVPGQMYRLVVDFGPGVNAPPKVMLGTHPGYDDVFTMSGTSGEQSLDFVPDTNSVSISLTDGAVTQSIAGQRLTWRQLQSMYPLGTLSWSQIRALMRGTATITAPNTGVQRTLKFKQISVQAYGTYSFAPNTLTFSHGRGLIVPAGSYAATGAAAKLIAARVANASSGIYSITGATPGVYQGHLLRAAGATYAVTGVAAGLKASRLVNATPGIYTIAGSNPLLMRKYIMPLAAGTYVLSPVAVGTLLGHRIKAPPGTYQLNGTTATINYRATPHLFPDPGSYTLTGGALGFTYAHVLHSAAGSYLTQGHAAHITATRTLALGAGTYTLTGGDASLTKGAAAIAMGNGVYRLTGAAVRMTVQRQMSFGTGSYTMTGQGVTLRVDRKLSGSGIYTLLMQDPVASAGRTMAIPVGGYNLTGVAANVQRHFQIINSGGIYAVAGAAISLRTARRLTPDPYLYQLVFTSNTPVYQRRLGGPRALFAEVAPSRYLAAPAQNRKLAVCAQDRVLRVPAQSRYIAVTPLDGREVAMTPLDRKA